MAAMSPRHPSPRRPGNRRTARSRNGANPATVLTSVQTPQAAPARAARGIDGVLRNRTDTHTASVVNSSIVGSWRTKATLVTSRGFTARNRAAPAAQAREAVMSRNRRNAARVPAARRIAWKTAADFGDVVPVMRYQPPRRVGNNGGRYAAGVAPSIVKPLPAATFRASVRYSTASFFTSGSG